MNKVILFLWFGNEKPPYVEWTLENFRKMNPGWEIRYIEYTNEQIQNYHGQNDLVLNKVMTMRENFGYIGNVSNEYRKKYLSMHPDELIVYCDLDCFPIAPFDNFLITQEKNFPTWIYSDTKRKPNSIQTLGYWVFNRGNLFVQRPDVWCMCNSKLISTNNFILIHKELCAQDEITFKESILINKNKVSEYKQRNTNFHEMKIELGDNFCLPKFSPVEHYYSKERNKLNVELKGNI